MDHVEVTGCHWAPDLQQRPRWFGCVVASLPRRFSGMPPLSAAQFGIQQTGPSSDDHEIRIPHSCQINGAIHVDSLFI